MTLVNTQTGEITESMDESAARRLTDRIRLLAENVAEQLDKMAALIAEARDGSAWHALGYRSWTDYVASEFENVLPRLDREPRREFVRELSATGMSSRAIAPVVGASAATVKRDLAPGSDEPPRPIPGGPIEQAQARIAEREEKAREREYRGLDEVVARTSGATPIVGIDGKTYTRPEPVVTPNNGAITWRRTYMAEIRKSARLIVVPPEDVIKNADHALLTEFFRAVDDINNYAERVRALVPTGLTVIKGDAQ